MIKSVNQTLEALRWSLPLALASLLLQITSASAQSTNALLDIQVKPGFRPNPIERSGISGGPIAVSEIVRPTQTPTGPCLGYVNRSPDHIVVLEAYFPSLRIGVTSQQDTTLVVQGPDGVWCNDDADGHNPAIAGQWAAGDYQVWVGSYGPTLSAPYTLYVREERTP